MKVASVVIWLLTLAYPLLVYFSLTHFQPRYLALLILAIALARLGTGRRDVLAWTTAGAALTLALTAG